MYVTYACRLCSILFDITTARFGKIKLCVFSVYTYLDGIRSIIIITIALYHHQLGMCTLHSATLLQTSSYFLKLSHHFFFAIMTQKVYIPSYEAVFSCFLPTFSLCIYYIKKTLSAAHKREYTMNRNCFILLYYTYKADRESQLGV